MRRIPAGSECFMAQLFHPVPGKCVNASGSLPATGSVAATLAGTPVAETKVPVAVETRSAVENGTAADCSAERPALRVRVAPWPPAARNCSAADDTPAH